MVSKYDDIINMPRHISKTRPQMSLYNRSAQFAPFAALTGYEEMVKETARLTDNKIEIDDGLRNIINKKLNIIREHLKEKPEITITYFVKDRKKSGGQYLTLKCVIRRIDLVNQEIILNDRSVIKLDDIININGNLIEGLFE
ncbi:MAG: hypothetical protein J6K45_00635 [Clostridia bacterium]|nr:hypothetical protein [Clostridia bacterium]